LQDRAPVDLGQWTGVEAFTPVATGYKGDPAFMAVAPDGHTVILGAGAGSGHVNKVYKFDAADPLDYAPDTVVATVGHYSGVMLNDRLLLVDKATDDFSTCELAVVDISAPAPAARSVMLKPPAAQLNPGDLAASAPLAINAARTTVYTMGLVYDSSYMVARNPLKAVSVAALINAYNTSTPLSWDTDARQIGGSNTYNSGGPAAVLPGGDVLIGGFGGIQRVNPATALIVDTYAPAGMDYYGIGYNAYTGLFLPIVAEPDYSMDVVYAPQGAFGQLPALNALGLLALAGTLLCAASTCITRKVKT
jgi:hypothetical protein